MKFYIMQPMYLNILVTNKLQCYYFVVFHTYTL